MVSEKGKIDCPICQNQAAFFTCKNNCNLFRCGKCGLVFVYPIVDEYRDIYQKTYLKDKEELQHAGDAEAWEATAETYEKYLRKLEMHHSEKGRLFDVGSATGLFIEIALKQGWEASGIEISKKAAEAGAGKGLNISYGDFESWQGSKDFEVVTFWDVLEHFLDPENAIRNARKILKKGGILAINTPDSKSILMKAMGKHWHHFNPPSHLHYFNIENLKGLLEKNGFETIYAGRVGKKFTLQQISKLLAMWQRISLWKTIYGFLSQSRWGDLKIPINTRDNLFILARKVN